MSFDLEPRKSAAFLTASVFDGQSWHEHPTFLDLTGGAVHRSSSIPASGSTVSSSDSPTSRWLAMQRSPPPSTSTGRWEWAGVLRIEGVMLTASGRAARW